MSRTTTLYYSPGACSLAVHIVLEELGAPFSLALVSTSDGSTKAPEYLRLNPKGRVPVLTVGDTVLTEVPAILLYLALSHPAAMLTPSTPEGLARCVEWFNWISSTVHAVAIRQIWRTESFTHDPGQYEHVVAMGHENLNAAFEYIEKRMTDSIWAVGGAYSIVDPYLLVFYRWGNRIGLDMQNRFEAWTCHTRCMLQRPAVGRALLQEEISVRV
jgi:glutathione S-transferase